jgi:hypothetical protein
MWNKRRWGYRVKQRTGGIARGILAALILAVSLVVSAHAGNENDAPRIAVAGQRFDFGTVTAGTVLEHVFEIRNAGTGVLVIREVRPS